MKATQPVLLLIRSLRVYQWTKNLLVLAPLFFARDILEPRLLLLSLGAFVAFCLATSATYIFNDIRDLEQDRAHPKKRNRPLASGALSLRAAWMLIAALLVAAGALAIAVGRDFLLALLLYLALTIAYTLALKHKPILDVLSVSIGFVIRAIAGALAIDVTFTNWLAVCTLFLALFLSLAKRRHELIYLDADARQHRKVLHHYSVVLLDQLTLIVATGALLTYTIYTCAPDVAARLGTNKLYLTIPFVVYGLFRYLYLVYNEDDGGDPSATLISDWPLLLTVLLWALSCGVIIYG